MVVDVGHSLSFWVEAINTTCYTQNQSIIVKRDGKTSYELIKGRKSNISYFHVFGCVCFKLQMTKEYSYVAHNFLRPSGCSI